MNSYGRAGLHSWLRFGRGTSNDNIQVTGAGEDLGFLIRPRSSQRGCVQSKAFPVYGKHAVAVVV